MVSERLRLESHPFSLRLHLRIIGQEHRSCRKPASNMDRKWLDPYGKNPSLSETPMCDTSPGLLCTVAEGEGEDRRFGMQHADWV